jgi:hypothetical protein
LRCPAKALSLSDLIAPTLTLDCEQAKHGDARLTDLRAFLTADCPNRAKPFDPRPMRGQI